MSTSEKAFGLVKTLFTFKEQQEDLEKDIAALTDRLNRLAEAHAALRDRVSRIEGMIEGAAIVREADKRQPRIEG